MKSGIGEVASCGAFDFPSKIPLPMMPNHKIPPPMKPNKIYSFILFHFLLIHLDSCNQPFYY